jgi:predicted dehydrogenase
LYLDTPDGQRRALPLEPLDTLADQLVDFAASIREGHLPEVDGLTGLHNVAVLEAAVESSRRGEPVAVREMFERVGALDLLARYQAG